MPQLRQGDRPYFVTLGDDQALTVTPDAGSSAIVRTYPRLLGGESTSQVVLGAGQSQRFLATPSSSRFAIEVTAGSVQYVQSLFEDAGWDGTQFTDPVKALVSGAGRLARPRVLFVGDSIPDYGSAPQTINQTSSTTPYGNSAFSIVYLSWDNGSGSSGTLNFNKAAQTLSWQSQGEAAGAPVDVSKAGVYTIASSTPSKTITVVCRTRAYAGSTEGAFAVTTTAGTEFSRRSAKSFVSWVHAKAGAGFDLSYLSNGGSSIADVAESISWQVGAAQYDVAVLCVGTNDLPRDRTLAQMQTDFSLLLSTLLAKVSRVLVTTINPRSITMTAARRLVLSGFNNWLATQRAPGLTVVNTFARNADPASATADPAAGATDDGLHPAIRGAEAIGEAIYLALADICQFESVSGFSSQIDTYDATSNPQGNQAPFGGTWSGSGGSMGTGISGTLADGWSLNRNLGSTITAVCSKVVRSDGLPGNAQRLVVSNAGAGAETVLLRCVSGNRPAAVPGQVWRGRAAVLIVDSAGLERLEFTLFPIGPAAGTFGSSWGGGSVAGSALTGAKRRMTMEPFPLTAVSTVSNMDMQLEVRLAAGGSCTLDLLPGEWRLWRES